MSDPGNDRRKWLVFAATGTASLATVSIISMINTMSPTLVEYFGSNVVTIQWMVLIYSLTMAGLLLAFGRLADIVGRRRVFAAGFVLFGLGSGLCSLAPTLPILLLCRVVQASGAAMLVSNSMPIVVGAFPPNQRGRALGLNGVAASISSLLGPSIAGILISTVSWRATFVFLVPVSAVGAVLTWRFVPDIRAEGKQVFDLRGAALFALTVVPLTAFFNQGTNLGWTSPLILGLLAVGLTSGTLFVWLNHRTEHPILDLSLLRNRMFALSNVGTLLATVGWQSHNFLLPFFLQNALGYSPAQMGLLMMAPAATQIWVNPISGWLVDKLGCRVPGTIGFLFEAGALLWMSATPVGTPTWLVIIKLMAIGMGFGLTATPNSAGVLGSVHRDKVGAASGFMTTMRHIGIASGVAIIGTLFATRSAFHAGLLGSSDASLGYAPGFRDAVRVLAMIDATGAVLSWLRGTQMCPLEAEGVPVRQDGH